ncbi:MAG: NAD(P)-binding domain-containing protein, partial [Bryobacteraceae bacterium]|nr:NAD(P)-binding domain-containing protein [Bryobacteraceae bacterium]
MATSVRPEINERFESNIPGVFVIGDLAGSPLVKLAMEQGYEVALALEQELQALGGSPTETDVYDVLVIGAGGAGLNCAAELQSRGRRVVVIEKEQIGSTVANLPEGKWIYTEPEERPSVGLLPLRAAVKDDVVESWRSFVRSAGLQVREGEAVTSLRREEGVFSITTSAGRYRARRVVVATGKAGSPKKLGVPGEDLAFVQHRLFQTRKYQNEQILVVGGGNSAVEAALALAESNQVTLSYRGSEFTRLSKENSRRLRGASNIQVLLGSKVTGFAPGVCQLEGGPRACDHAFVLIGSEPPRDFLKALGIRLEDEWGWKKWAALL